MILVVVTVRIIKVDQSVNAQMLLINVPMEDILVTIVNVVVHLGLVEMNANVKNCNA